MVYLGLICYLTTEIVHYSNQCDEKCTVIISKKKMWKQILWLKSV